MVSKEEFLNWFEREKNRRKQDKINKEAAIDRDNYFALRRRRKMEYTKYWRRHKDDRY